MILLFVSVALPLAQAWRVWRLHERSFAAWLATVADAAVFVALVLLVGRWDIAGYYTRFVLLAVFVAAVLCSLWRHAALPWRAPDDGPVLRSHWSTMLSLLLFAAALAYVVSGTLPPREPHGLVFPLKDGRFMIGQGGGIGLLNHHAGHPEQRHAADITAIGTTGFRAEGVLPEDLDRYAMYGAPVVSPCDGEVISVRDGLPDLVPPETDPENPVGNHIIIACGDLSVELAHLQEGSITVAVGDRLAPGRAIARVGNSGNTTEPHLHVHAVEAGSGSGVPMSFGGRAPVRNRVFEP